MDNLTDSALFNGCCVYYAGFMRCHIQSDLIRLHVVLIRELRCSEACRGAGAQVTGCGFDCQTRNIFIKIYIVIALV